MARGSVLRTMIFVLLLFSISWPCHAQPSAIAERINILKDLVEAIGAAGDAAKKLADGIKHLVVTGVEGYDAASARITYARLVDISKATTDLAVSQQVLVVETLEQYLDRPDPKAWPRVVDRLGSVLTQVNDVLAKVQKDKSDFVLRPAYEKLSMALRARVSLIQRLQSYPAPSSEQELKLLREANDKYIVLISQLREARDQLNEYLAQRKK